MPIPQLKNTNQSWRNNNKKYYINKKNNKKSSSNNFNKKDRKEFFRKLKKNILIGLVLLGIAGTMLLVILFMWLSRNLPNPNQLSEREVAQSTKIYDRTGEEILYEIHGEEERTLVTIDEIPDHVEWAVIAMEDRDFYNHGGFSIWAIARSLFKMIFAGGRGSGSTLTQQLVKNAILTNERSINRKVKELMLSYKIELKYSKKEILQMYLNEIPYGSTAYGVEAASKRYFGKHVQEINIAEAAILAALIQAPTRYSPYGSNKDLLIGRQQYIIGLMAEQGHITKEEAEEAKNFELEFKSPGTNIKAPHFVMYVKEILTEKYGEKMVEQGGLKIHTTLDLYKQEIAEEVIKEQSEKNEENYESTNAALLSIDPKTGQVLAMVGSRDYFNDEIDGQVNITTSKRQPGSSMKPLVFASTFLKGFNANSILYDVVTNFSTNDDEEESYEPHNYDNEERGPVNIRKALAGSLNIPAVKGIYLAGVDNVLDLAQDLGYTTFSDRDRFGLSLVLGGGEVKMIEHVNAYSAFAREGEIHPINVILKVEDKDGKVLEEFELETKKVLDPKAARQINDILSDNNARAYAFGLENWLNLGERPVAAKTGTTNDYRDAWTIGYTPSIVTGVWVGNNDNSEMKRGAAGGIVAAPIWNKYMKQILGDTPIEKFKEIEIEETGIPMLDGEAGMEVVVKIDKNSGLLATESTPPESIEEKTFKEPHSILHFINKEDPLGGAPENPANDPQYKLWEEAIQKWLENQDIATSAPPTEFDNLHTIENLPEIAFVSPQNNTTIREPKIEAYVRVTAPRGVNRVEYYINDNLISISNSYPYGLSENINFLNNGFHNLKARGCDDVDNCSTAELEFNLSLKNSTKQEDLKFSIFNPKNGLSLLDSDFPVSIDLSLNSPKQVAQINCYQNNQIFTTIQPVNNIVVNTQWNEIPSTGTYSIYCETNNWSGEKQKTNEILLNINNTKETIEETEDNEEE